MSIENTLNRIAEALEQIATNMQASEIQVTHEKENFVTPEQIEEHVQSIEQPMISDSEVLEPAPVIESAPAEQSGELTLEEITKTIGSIAKKLGPDCIKIGQLLHKKYSCKKLSELDNSKYSEVLNDVKAMIQ